MSCIPAVAVNRRRSTVAVGLALGALMLSPLAVQAQSAYPNKPITIIVPFSAGGTTDILARVIGQGLSRDLGQPVVVDNRAGAGGNIGAQAVARAAPDGYTLVMGTVGTHAINASLYAKMPFDPVKDFAPISRVALVPNLLVAHPAQPYKNVKELIAYAKANPGKVTVANSGVGTSIHLSAELFKHMAGVDVQNVAYRGSAPALNDLIGGHTAVMFDNMPSAIGYVRAGKLRPLAVTTATRSAALPDVPTVAESGVPGFEATSWFGLLAPARTPAPVIARLNASIQKVLADPEVKKKLLEQGAEPLGETPQQFAGFIASESAKWGKVVKQSGASAQ
jgi:tripartite-type tricarboxylate transporter receptor subunit TctC